MTDTMTADKLAETRKKKGTAYERIATVLKAACRKLAIHEFEQVYVTVVTADEAEDHVERQSNGKRYVGYSEQTLGRRLREMVDRKLATCNVREGKNFKEYELI